MLQAFLWQMTQINVKLIPALLRYCKTLSPAISRYFSLELDTVT